MKFSAPKVPRKWPYAGLLSVDRLMVIAISAFLGVFGDAEPCIAAQRSGSPADGAELRNLAVPLPNPRPIEAPRGQTSAPAGANGPAAGSQSACRLALSDGIAVAPSIPDVHGPGGCGGEDLVRLEAVILPDQRRVEVRPPAVLRCSLASAIVGLVRTDLAPLAAGLGGGISGIEDLDAFECRGRNRLEGAPLSEHGRANALDLRALKLANGQSIALTDRTVSHGFREEVLHALCARFSTVLGPGSDWYHEDHIHLDLKERRNNYRICQWDIWHPLPQIAPLLPPERPQQAPPREMAINSRPGNAVTSPDPNPGRAGEVHEPIKKRR